MIFDNNLVVLASPTIETGISIDGTHFDGVYAIANGVQTVDAFCQTIERVRADVPRHICISNKAIQRVGNGSTNIRSLLRSEHQIYKANRSLLSLIDDVAEQDERDRIHLSTWGSYAIKVNFGYLDYKGSILRKLKDEGYEVVNFEVDITQSFLTGEVVEEAILEARDDNYKVERDGKIAAENPTDLEYKKLQKQRSKTTDERHTEAKGMLARRYLTEDITDEMIVKDDDGWYSKLQIHYYLSLGWQHLAARDGKKLEALAPGAKPFKPDANRSLISTKVAALELLNVAQFFGEDKVFTSPELIDWHQKVLQCRMSIKDWLGINISAKSTPVNAAQQMLGTLGFRLTYIDRIKINDKWVRRYAGVDCDFDGRSTIFSRWAVAEMAERSTDSYRSIYKVSGSDLSGSVSGSDLSGSDQSAEIPNQNREVEVAAPTINRIVIGDRVKIKNTNIEGVLDGWGRDGRTGWLVMDNGNLSDLYPASSIIRATDQEEDAA